MLYVFYGNNLIEVRQAAQAKLTELREANPDLMVEHIEAEDYEPGILSSASSNVSLFSQPAAYYLDQPATNLEYLDEVREMASALANSVNYFIVSEGTLLTEYKKPLLAVAKEMVEYKGATTQEFNIFQLADSLANRDKQTLWFLLQTARRNDIVTEKIVGVLWWQLKTLNLASITKSASEAGVKDFPYNKAKRALKNFKPGQITLLTRDLLTLYHESHRGKKDINLALEEWVLKI